jgi:hypothetical protein
MGIPSGVVDLIVPGTAFDCLHRACIGLGDSTSGEVLKLG